MDLFNLLYKVLKQFHPCQLGWAYINDITSVFPGAAASVVIVARVARGCQSGERLQEITRVARVCESGKSLKEW